MSQPEKLQSGEIKIPSEAAAEQSEKLRSLETSAEKSPESDSERVAADARKETEAIFAHEAGKEQRSGGEPTASPTIIRKITAREKQRAYRQTLVRVQSEMNAPARTFSKAIHSPAVEKMSEVVGSTAARPNALLFGSIAAFIAVGMMYTVARMYGYHLSGFEMIGAYLFGWAAGLAVDYTRLLTTGKAI